MTSKLLATMIKTQPAAQTGSVGEALIAALGKKNK